MRYFILKQDRNLPNVINIKGFDNFHRKVILKEEEDKFKDLTNILVEGNKDSVYPVFLQAPTYLISDELHKVFKMFENTIIFKTAVVTNLELRTQKVYRLLITDILDVLHKDTTYLKNGWVHKIVLDRKKVGDYNIFQIKAGIDYYLIISIDVLESMLKRGLNIGIEIQEVEVK